MYVYEHVSTYQPTVYTLSAFWAGQEGSLLLWLWLLTIFSALIALLPRRGGNEGGANWNQELKPYALRHGQRRQREAVWQPAEGERRPLRRRVVHQDHSR